MKESKISVDRRSHSAAVAGGGVLGTKKMPEPRKKNGKHSSCCCRPSLVFFVSFPGLVSEEKREAPLAMYAVNDWFPHQHVALGGSWVFSVDKEVGALVSELDFWHGKGDKNLGFNVIRKGGGERSGKSHQEKMHTRNNNSHTRVDDETYHASSFISSSGFLFFSLALSFKACG